MVETAKLHCALCSQQCGCLIANRNQQRNSVFHNVWQLGLIAKIHGKPHLVVTTAILQPAALLRSCNSTWLIFVVNIPARPCRCPVTSGHETLVRSSTDLWRVVVVTFAGKNRIHNTCCRWAYQPLALRMDAACGALSNGVNLFFCVVGIQ